MPADWLPSYLRFRYNEMLPNLLFASPPIPQFPRRDAQRHACLGGLSVPVVAEETLQGLAGQRVAVGAERGRAQGHHRIAGLGGSAAQGLGEAMVQHADGRGAPVEIHAGAGEAADAVAQLGNFAARDGDFRELAGVVQAAHHLVYHIVVEG
nr:hypothetical protein [Tanacetum cinerariifolium]